jgi:DinB superfamily
MTTSAAHPDPLPWADLLADQLDQHWTIQARPRLQGLTDQEYRWEPVPGCWSVRPREQGVAMAVGAGDAVIDFAFPEPDPPPVTTIAWRLNHVIIGVFAARNASYFGGPPTDYATFDYSLTAAPALAQLDEAYARWIAGVRGLTREQLAQPCGQQGHEEDPMATLVLHIHREAIHHLAEVALLRDLYRRWPAPP